MTSLEQIQAVEEAVARAYALANDKNKASGEVFHAVAAVRDALAPLLRASSAGSPGGEA